MLCPDYIAMDAANIEGPDETVAHGLNRFTSDSSRTPHCLVLALRVRSRNVQPGCVILLMFYSPILLGAKNGGYTQSGREDDPNSPLGIA